jgi:hypothetical protein
VLDELRCAADNGDNGGDGGSNIEIILRLHYLVFINFCIIVFLPGKFLPRIGDAAEIATTTACFSYVPPLLAASTQMAAAFANKHADGFCVGTPLSMLPVLALTRSTPFGQPASEGIKTALCDLLN